LGEQGTNHLSGRDFVTVNPADPSVRHARLRKAPAPVSCAITFLRGTVLDERNSAVFRLVRRTDRVWRRRIVGALCAGVFLLTFLALAPHLVHHLFEPEHHHAASCPFLALSYQAPLQPDALNIAPPLRVVGAANQDVAVWPLVLPVCPCHSRAPPQPSSVV
jgi:hypothetical protein